MSQNKKKECIYLKAEFKMLKNKIYIKSLSIDEYQNLLINKGGQI